MKKRLFFFLIFLLCGKDCFSMQGLWKEIQHAASHLKGQQALSSFWKKRLVLSKQVPEEVLDFVRDNEKPIVTTPYHWPDLDGVASAYALDALFKHNDVESRFCISEIPQYEAQWMMTHLGITPSFLTRDDRSLLALVDTSDPLDIPSFVDLKKVALIIDHRKYAALAAFPNAVSWINPVGSAATLITKLYTSVNLEPDAISSQLLYAAIMSNTISCQTNNTTLLDKMASEYLKSLTDIPPDLIINMLKAKSEIPHLKEFLDQDLSSRYHLVRGKEVAVAQVEVTDPLNLVLSRESELLESLLILKEERKVDELFLMLLGTTDYKTYFFFPEESFIPSFLNQIIPMEKTIKTHLYTSPLYTRKEVIALLKDKERI